MQRHVSGRGVSIVGDPVAVEIAVAAQIRRNLARLHHDLGAAIAVHVVDDERRKPDARLDVRPHVAPPEERAVTLVGFELEGLVTRCVLRHVDIGVAALDHEVVLAVTVQITDSHQATGLRGAVVQRDADVRVRRVR